MGIEKVTSIRMKFVGHFKGNKKVVELPIPLISNSMKQELFLEFTRTGPKGPAFCDVPIEWAGQLIAVGGNWQTVDKLTPEQEVAIEQAKKLTEKRMEKFAIENELVEA